MALVPLINALDPLGIEVILKKGESKKAQFETRNGKRFESKL